MAHKLLAAGPYTSSDTGARWSDGSGNYDSEETYVDVDKNSETYRMQWELYEGSIALVQMALVWKEITTQKTASTDADGNTILNLQVDRNTNGNQTLERLRIRRIW